MIKRKNCVRLFRVEKMPFLFGDFWIHSYKRIGIFYTSKDETRISYLPKKLLPKTYAEGRKIYSSWKSYCSFKKTWEAYAKELKACFESQQKILSKKEVKETIRLLSDFFSYYGKTEYIYVDAVVDKGVNKAEAVLKDFGPFKNKARKFTNKVWLGSESYVMCFVKKLSRQFDVEAKDILDYGPHELLDLFGGERVSNATLSLRRGDYVNGNKAIFGEKAQRFLRKFYGSERSSTTFKGIVASRGGVRGRVWVIPPLVGDYDTLPKLLKDMPKGWVLLAETTSPDLILACRKASAIITDQGGLMSHAAVISRELEIPCIVNLRYALDVLKTGDLVEVDANKGVVRILKRG